MSISSNIDVRVAVLAGLIEWYVATTALSNTNGKKQYKRAILFTSKTVSRTVLWYMEIIEKLVL